ncbi:MAG: nicotinate (nicotinamide) nucleotide adenylyltransferase [Desulfobacterales bacterium]|nr:nicotinate (nicotinamide) nucleotide adenylyltransferase [Desulfobacterales bacterium]
MAETLTSKGDVVIFGGTFNPVHTAHTHVVKEMSRILKPGKLIVVPAAVPPHKRGRGIAEAHHRVAMLELAMRGLPATISHVELDRTGPSYTVDTLRLLKAQEREERPFYLTMGVDAFFDFHTWRDEKEILLMSGLIVVNRPGTDHGHLPVDVMLGYLKEKIDDGYFWSSRENRFVHPRFMGVIPLTVPPVSPLSSTDVRKCLEKGDRPTDLLHPEVLRYIEEKGLYR